MITYYYKSLRTQNLAKSDAPKRGTWVYVENPNEKEVKQLVDKFKLDESLIRDALDEDEMPRLEKSSEQIYIFVRMAYTTRQGVFETVPLLFVFAGEYVFTVSLKQLVCLDVFLEGKMEFATTQRAKLILQIMQELVQKYDTYITATSKQIKVIRSRLRGHEIANKDFVDFVTIEDELNEFLSALVPTNATLRRLALGRHLPLFAEDQDLIEDLLLTNEQSIEASRSNIKSIINIRQAYSSISSNNINRTMKILTLATVMISLPNIIFSMYGMNVGLPLQDNPWAFTALVSVVVLTLVLALIVLWRKRII